MKRNERINRRGDFQKIYREGRSFANRVAVVYVVKGHGETAQVAIAAGRKLGTAVRRNRVKRQLREAIRQYWGRIVPGTRLLFIARPGALTVPFAVITQKVRELLGRSGVWLEPREGE